MREDNDLSLSDLKDSTIIRENETLLSLMLKDYTTGKNIKWGTDSYINHGYLFREDQEIKIDLITGQYEGFIRPRVDKDIGIQLERQRNKAEVFTPSWVIKLQVDTALEDMEQLPLIDFIKTKWLEITCGEAPYMVNRYDMETGEVISLKDRAGFIDVKFKKMNQGVESEEEWLKLAVEIYKASYGYEYQGDSLFLARENLILTFIDNYFYMFGALPNEKVLLEITKIISLNVFQMDGLTYEIPYSDGGAKEYGTQLSLIAEVDIKKNTKPKLAKIKSWNENKLIEFKELSDRSEPDMKFDIVLGNPPYDGRSSTGANYAKSIYPDFMDSAYTIGSAVILITPSRFLFNGGNLKVWNEKMLSDKHLKVVDYWADASEVFSNIDIKGGVAITYRNDVHTFNPIGHFIPYAEMKSVINKIDYSNTESLMSDVYSQSAYHLSDLVYEDFQGVSSIESLGKDRRLESNILSKVPELFKDNNDRKTDSLVAILGSLNRKRVYQWVDKSYITYPSNFKKFKVIIPSANGSGKFGERISQPLVGNPMVGHTRTFMSVGSYDSETEANNCLKYISSKFTRSLLSVLKVTQNTSPGNWKYVPLQDFTENSDIDWSQPIAKIDQQLYKKYGLNEEEIEFIETHVKAME